MYKQIPGFRNLENAYHKANDSALGLYHGAGVNLFSSEWKTIRKKIYKTYTWKELLKALHKKNEQSLTASYEQLVARCTNKDNLVDWAKPASKLVGHLDVPEFIGQLDEIIYNRIPHKDKYGRLSKRLLDQAPTLHAAIAFSAEIDQKTDNSWTFKRNHQIGMVATLNYDFYFVAGWTRYQAFKEHWTIQTPFCSGTREIPEECQKVVPSTPKAYWALLMKCPAKTSKKRKGVR